MFPRSCFGWLVVFLGLGLPGSASAATIFDNFGPGNSFSASGRIVQGPAVGTIGDVDQASSFTVGATDFLLTNISLGINVQSPPNVGTGPLDVLLTTDAGGSPGAVLRTLPINVNSTGEQVITVVDGTQILDANTTYWVVADGMGEFDGSWRFNDTGDVGLTAGRSNGNPWNVRPADDRYALRVEGRVVPEPATPWLLSLGLGSLGIMRRRNLAP